MIGLILVVFGILVLVYRSKYRNLPTRKSKNTLKILTIIHTAFFSIHTIILLGTLTLFMIGGLSFEFIGGIVQKICMELEIGSGYIAQVAEDITIFVISMMKTAMIVNVLLFVFGLIALIFGFSTLADKGLKSATESELPLWNSNQNESTVQHHVSTSEGWSCLCGTSNTKIANFCSHCGNKRP